MATTLLRLQQSVVAITLSTLMVACGKQDAATQSGPVSPPMPVNVIKMEITSVPISTQAVAQTEGAKEVEIRPRVGGILLKKLFEEGAPIKAGQPMFLIDPAPFKIAVDQARAQVAQQRARITQRPNVKLLA